MHAITSDVYWLWALFIAEIVLALVLAVRGGR